MLRRDRSGGHRNAEQHQTASNSIKQRHLVLFGRTLALDVLAVRGFALAPLQHVAHMIALGDPLTLRSPIRTSMTQRSPVSGFTYTHVTTRLPLIVPSIAAVLPPHLLDFQAI